MLAAVEKYILERKRPVTAKQIAEYLLISVTYARQLCKILARESIEVKKIGRTNYYKKRDHGAGREGCGSDHRREVL